MMLTDILAITVFALWSSLMVAVGVLGHSIYVGIKTRRFIREKLPAIRREIQRAGSKNRNDLQA